MRRRTTHIDHVRHRESTILLSRDARLGASMPGSATEAPVLDSDLETSLDVLLDGRLVVLQSVQVHERVIQGTSSCMVLRID